MISEYDKLLLISLYQKAPEALDKLPYTASFEEICSEFGDQCQMKLDRSEIWRTLTNIRKTGCLPRKGRTK
jgi:hypothetical protein